MAFIMFCLVLALAFRVAWDFISKPDKRDEMLSVYLRSPVKNSIILVWITFMFMFFIGILIPPVGNMNLTEDGWQVWEVGGWGFFGMFLVNILYDMDRPQ